MKNTSPRRLVPMSLLVPGLIGIAACDLSSGSSDQNGSGFSAYWCGDDSTLFTYAAVSAGTLPRGIQSTTCI